MALLQVNDFAVVIQYKPCWTLHAILRFNNIKYILRNSQFPQAYGKKLPLVLLNDTVYDEMTVCTSFYPISNHEELFSHYIENRLVLGLEYLENLTTSPKSYFNPLEFFNIPPRHSHTRQRSIYTSMSIPDVKKKILEAYDFVETLLSPVTLFIDPADTKTKPSYIDALLFGHIADALLNHELKYEIQRRKKISDFFHKICSAYFTIDTYYIDQVLWENNHLKSNINNDELKNIVSKNQINNKSSQQKRMNLDTHEKVSTLKSFKICCTEIILDPTIYFPDFIKNFLNISDIKLYKQQTLSLSTALNSSAPVMENNVADENNNNKISQFKVGPGSLLFTSCIFTGFAYYGVISMYAITVLGLQRLRYKS